MGWAHQCRITPGDACALADLRRSKVKHLERPDLLSQRPDPHPSTAACLPACLFATLGGAGASQALIIQCAKCTPPAPPCPAACLPAAPG